MRDLTLKQWIAFLRAADDAARTGQNRFRCPICHRQAVILDDSAASCWACSLVAPVQPDFPW